MHSVIVLHRDKAVESHLYTLWPKLWMCRFVKMSIYLVEGISARGHERQPLDAAQCRCQACAKFPGCPLRKVEVYVHAQLPRLDAQLLHPLPYGMEVNIHLQSQGKIFVEHTLQGCGLAMPECTAVFPSVNNSKLAGQNLRSPVKIRDKSLLQLRKHRWEMVMSTPDVWDLDHLACLSPGLWIARDAIGSLVFRYAATLAPYPMNGHVPTEIDSSTKG